MKVEPIEVLIGASLLPLVNGEQSLLTERIAALRKQVDPGTVFYHPPIVSVEAAVGMLLTRGETDKLLQRIRDDQSGLVEELVPTVVSVSDIQKILQNLLREKVLVRHLEAILETLADAGRNSKDLGYLVVGPKFADQLLARLASQADRMMKANMRPVLLCAPDLRRHVRALCERVLPPMRVLSMAEVPNSVNLKAYTTVSL